MATIFISHSSKDTDFARRLATSLQQWGANVWIDVDDIAPGSNWSTSIWQGLDSTDVMLLVISPDAASSRNVENEWQYFLDEKKLVIPILWRPAKVHFQLRRLQYIDFEGKGFDLALQRLCSYLGIKGFGINNFATQPIITAVPQPAKVSPEVAQVTLQELHSRARVSSSPSLGAITRTGIIGVLIVVFSCFFCIGGILKVGSDAILGQLNSTKLISDIGDQYMTALKNSDYDTAYSLIESDWQKDFGGSASGMREKFIGWNWDKLIEWKFTNINTNNNEVDVFGTVTLASGTKKKLSLVLGNSDGKWKIIGMNTDDPAK